MSFAGAAFAGGDYEKEKSQEQNQELGQQNVGQEFEEKEGLGGSGQEGQELELGEQQEEQDAAIGGAAEEGQQPQVEGEVVQKSRDLVYLKLEQGAVVPVKVNNQTEFTWTQQQQQQQTEGTGGAGQAGKKGNYKKMTQKLEQGDTLSVTVRTERGQNLAQKVEVKQQAQQGQELQGEVASTSGNWINIDHEGALVPLKVDRDTQFEGISGLKELKEGTQVSAQFRIQSQTQNVATKIQARQSEGTGGAWEEGQKPQEQQEFEQQEPQEQLDQDLQQPEPEPGSFEQAARPTTGRRRSSRRRRSCVSCQRCGRR
jgi:hypothetical protein